MSDIRQRLHNQVGLYADAYDAIKDLDGRIAAKDEEIAALRDELEVFHGDHAALVDARIQDNFERSAQLDSLCQMTLRLGFSTGHADDIAGLIRELEPQITTLREQLTELQNWKDEATKALNRWDGVFMIANAPCKLGQFKSSAVADELVRLQEQLARKPVLEARIADAVRIAGNAPELNMGNYDDDQVTLINAALTEIYNLLTKSIDPPEQSEQEQKS